MNQTAIIIHGVQGNPEENWFPWLKKKLKEANHTVFVPQFPTPDNQTLENWMRVFEKYANKLGNDLILIGHSLGAAFLLNILEKYPAKAAFFISGFTGKAENEFDEGMKTFTHHELDWKKIRENCKNFTIFHSDNDPYIPLEKAEELAQNLGITVTLVKGAGHFNEAAGYTKFERLLGEILDFEF